MNGVQKCDITILGNELTSKIVIELQNDRIEHLLYKECLRRLQKLWEKQKEEWTKTKFKNKVKD